MIIGMMIRDKNPLTRISIEEIIHHEWVTIDGYYPINLGMFIHIITHFITHGRMNIHILVILYVVMNAYPY